MSRASDILRVAAAEIGYNRWNDPEQGTKYGRDYATRHGAYYATSGVPYCAMFVTWVLRQCGMTPVGGDFAYVPWMIAAAEREGQRLGNIHNARPGDYLCFDWDGDGVADHVGFVEVNCGTHVQTIEGNTSGSWNGSQSNGGGVYRRARGWDSVCAVIRPVFESDVVGASGGGLVVDGWWGVDTTCALQDR